MVAHNVTHVGHVMQPMSKQTPEPEDLHDALMMALAREWELPRACDTTGIDLRWLSSFVSLRFADVLAQLACEGLRLKALDAADRAWLKGQCESLVEDALHRFADVPGDVEYRPQDEPEYDFDGRTEGGE